MHSFTAKDQKSIQLAADNFPITPYCKIEKTLISMGIREALVITLNEEGITTPLAHTMIRPPLSRIGVLTSDELHNIVSNSGIMDN